MMNDREKEMVKSVHPKVVKLAVDIVTGKYKSSEQIDNEVNTRFTREEITFMATNDVLHFIESTLSKRTPKNDVSFQ